MLETVKAYGAVVIIFIRKLREEEQRFPGDFQVG